jgi:hypothetical protein
MPFVKGYLEIIGEAGGGPVDPGFGVPGWPAHPIAPGGPPPWVGHPIPPTVWPNPPGQGPGNPPGFWGGSAPWPGYPMPPMAPGGPPPVISHPIPPVVWPEPPVKPPGGGGGEHPMPPIYYPPSVWPGPGVPTHPIAPGGPPPHVEHPIPPTVWPQPPGPDGSPGRDKWIEWKAAWSPSTGWVTVGIPTDDAPAHVTPSAAPAAAKK